MKVQIYLDPFFKPIQLYLGLLKIQIHILLFRLIFVTMNTNIIFKKKINKIYRFMDAIGL